MVENVQADQDPGADTIGGAGPGPEPARRHFVLPALVSLVALLLPPRWLAGILAGASSPLIGEVTVGVWILKAALLVHGVGVPMTARALERARAGTPLLEQVRRKQPLTPGLMFGVAMLVVVGLALRLVDLGAGLWHDEIATLVDYGGLPVSRIVATYTTQNQHVLYSVLMRLSFTVFGENAWALRLPAAVMGAASLVAVFWFGSLITTRREAFLASLLLTVSYHHVWFSQNGRGYTSMMLFALVGSGFFLRMLTGEVRSTWSPVVGYATIMALAVYTHLTAAFVVVAHFVVWGVLVLRRRDLQWGIAVWAPFAALVLAASFAITLYALILPQMAETLFAPKAEFATTPWRTPLWLVAETLRGASRGLPGGWFGLAAGGTIALAGVAGYARRSWGVTALMLMPAVVTAGILIALGHNLWPRFFFFAAGFAAVIAVRGTFVLARLLPARQTGGYATALLVLGAAASALTVPAAWGPKQDYEGAWELVEAELVPGDAVAAAGLAGYAYEAWLHAPVTWVESASQLAAIESDHARTWFLYSFPTHLEAQAPELWSRVRAGYLEIAEFPGTVAGGAVHVMIRR